jgi:hypothetical protein
MELIEGPGYEMPATATATTRGFTSSLYKAVKDAVAEWMAPGKYDILHPPDKPFALLKPGETVMVRPGLSGPNRSAGASRDKAAIDAARQAGIPVRDPDTGLYPGAVKRAKYNPPR